MKGIVYRNEREQVLVEQLAREWDVDEVTVANAVAWMMSDDIDPIQPEGPVHLCDTQGVPGPLARVNLYSAKKQMRFDLRMAPFFIRKGSDEGLVRTVRSLMKWCEFWSVREQSPEGRRRWAALLQEWHEDVERLLVKLEEEK